MSNYAEIGPQGRGSNISPLVQSSAFRGYINTVVSKEVDIADMWGHANVITDSGSLLTKSLVRSTQQLEAALFNDGDPKVLRVKQQAAFRCGLLAYTYSGLAVDRTTVMTAAAAQGLTKRWVANTIRPDNEHLLKQDLGVTDRQERRRLRKLGLQTMRNLEVMPRFDRLTALRARLM